MPLDDVWEFVSGSGYGVPEYRAFIKKENARTKSTKNAITQYGIALLRLLPQEEQNPAIKTAIRYARIDIVPDYAKWFSTTIFWLNGLVKIRDPEEKQNKLADEYDEKMVFRVDWEKRPMYLQSKAEGALKPPTRRTKSAPKGRKRQEGRIGNRTIEPTAEEIAQQMTSSV
jgi:hypothetical protein